MKKTLKAVQQREAELMETVRSPLDWLLHHWFTLTIVALLVIGSVAGWQYHRYTVKSQANNSWEALKEAKEQEADDLGARAEAIQAALDEELVESVVPYALLDLGLTYEDARRVEDAEKVYQDLVQRFPSHIAGEAAQAHLDAIAASRTWEQEHAEETPTSTGEPNPVVRFITSKGAFEIELFEDQVPNSTANIVSLVDRGWYDSCVIHRVEPVEKLGVVQFGRRFNIPADLRTVQEAGPGYRIQAEIRSDLHHDKGTVAMARENDYDSAGSQIFINTRDNRAFFDGRYTVIGRVISGMDAIELLLANDDLVLEAEVTSRRDHDYVPETLPVE